MSVTFNGVGLEHVMFESGRFAAMKEQPGENENFYHFYAGCGGVVRMDCDCRGVRDPNPTAYVAHLQPMNTQVTGRQTTGQARLTISGDVLTISIKVKDAPPGIVHWQHFHGFKDNRAATCPKETADANGDGIVDLIETEPTSGTTMVPFDDDPAAMDVAHGSYPKASSDGTYTYQAKVSLKALQAAFTKAFGDSKLDLDHRVIFIHGVPSDTSLPASVASLGDIPAQVTLPIACGKIERIGQSE